MMLYISKFISSISVTITTIYLWYKLLNKKIDFKNYKLYITIFIVTNISSINCLITNKYIKIFVITITLIFFFRYLFKSDIQKTFITPIFVQILIMLSECIYALTMIIINFNINNTITSLKWNIISNIIICIILIILSNIKFIKKLYKKLISITENVDYIKLILLCMIGILIANILAMSVYYKISLHYLLVFNIGITLFLFNIIIYSFKTQNNYNKVSDKYNIAINSLKDYEEMMSKYRLANHENKNLLLAIRAMIINKDKDVPKYINSIIKDKYNDNEKLLLKVNVIPSGGLRATIYSEILKIKKKNIEFDLNIDRKLKTVDLVELDTNTIIDICKIIGVFIDNAIEEVENLDNKYIGINLYIEDNYLNIEISNNYNNKIEIEEIYERGFTTKGKGHGYGLSLVSKIIENNSIFDNQIKINKDFFSQILSIKYKNNNIK